MWPPPWECQNPVDIVNEVTETERDYYSTNRPWVIIETDTA